MSKKYGLLLPGQYKATEPIARKPKVFESDSGSDEEEDIKKRPGMNTLLKRQDRMLQERAVAEDPTVYQYDELFDDMVQKRTDSKLARRDLDRKPKYMNKLLESANRRKLENERRIERQIQKEREAEGDEFKDKEAFVTSAYRKKLEEMREAEERDKREEYLENIGDVRKQPDLGGFYRHLYEQQVKKERLSDEEEEDAKETNVVEKPRLENDEKDIPEPALETPSSSTVETASKEAIKKPQTKSKKRVYRRKDEDVSSEDEEAAGKMAHLNSNLDADSDFSIDSSSDDEATEKVPNRNYEEFVEERRKMVSALTGCKDLAAEQEQLGLGPAEEAENEVKVDEKVEEVVPEDEKKEEVPKKRKKEDIWKKRTVGEKFDEALARYFQRKAARNV